MTTTQDRREAAVFYFKPDGIDGYHEDWIRTGDDPDGVVDPDVKALAELLANWRRAAHRAGQEAMRERAAAAAAAGPYFGPQTCESIDRAIAAAIRALPVEGT